MPAGVFVARFVPLLTQRACVRAARSVALASVLLGTALVGAQPAQAQLFGWLGGGGRTFDADAAPSVPPGEIMRRLAGRGMRFNSALQRNGGVYLADVTDARGRQMRLVIDAYRGKVLQAFAYGPPRPAGFVPESRGFAPSPVYPGESYASRETYPPAGPGYMQQQRPVEPRVQDTPTREPRSTRASRARAAREAARDSARSASPVNSVDPAPASKVTPPAPSEATVNPIEPRATPRAAEPAKASAAIAQPALVSDAPQPAVPPVAATPRAPSAATAPASQDNKAGFANGVPINPLD